MKALKTLIISEVIAVTTVLGFTLSSCLTVNSRQTLVASAFLINVIATLAVVAIFLLFAFDKGCYVVADLVFVGFCASFTHNSGGPAPMAAGIAAVLTATAAGLVAWFILTSAKPPKPAVVRETAIPLGFWPLRLALHTIVQLLREAVSTAARLWRQAKYPICVLLAAVLVNFGILCGLPELL